MFIVPNRSRAVAATLLLALSFALWGRHAAERHDPGPHPPGLEVQRTSPAVVYSTMNALRMMWIGSSLLLPMGAPGVAPAAVAWSMNATQRSAVERGDIVVMAERRVTSADDRVSATLAAVRVAATPDAVFAVLTDCAAAPEWMPHLVECRVVETDRLRSSELIAHRVHYGWFAPRIDYVFRAHLQDRRRIVFENVSGDLVENDGTWALEQATDGVSTIVTYRVRTRPRFYVPQWLSRRAVRSELPDMLRALRRRAETAPRAAPTATNTDTHTATPAGV